MKVIDLLNKIANGEEDLPDIIIVGVEEDKHYYNKDLKEYINQRTGEKLFEDGYGKFFKYYLNDEVEILEDEPRDIEVCGSLFTKSEYDKLAHSEEEKKIPEKLDLYEETQNIIREYNYKLVYHDIHKCIVSLECKYNEIIDYLEENKWKK